MPYRISRLYMLDGICSNCMKTPFLLQKKALLLKNGRGFLLLFQVGMHTRTVLLFLLRLQFGKMLTIIA